MLLISLLLACSTPTPVDTANPTDTDVPTVPTDTAVPTVEPIVVEFDTYHPPMDVLFVVDNSCSMAEEQIQLASNAVQMFDVLATTTLDYHIGVVSTDINTSATMGRLHAVDNERFITPQTVDATIVFDRMVNVGTNGSYDEKGRGAAYTAIEVVPDSPENEGFFRPEASLDLVFLSDEEDQSGATPVALSEFRTWMSTLKGDPGDVVAHAIVGIPGQSCAASDTPGTMYLNYANLTGGSVTNLCGEDWTPGLRALVENRMARARVTLAEVPSEVLEVSFEHAGEPSVALGPIDYSIDGATLWFDRGVVPETDDIIRVVYLP